MSVIFFRKTVSRASDVFNTNNRWLLRRDRALILDVDVDLQTSSVTGKCKW